MTNHFTVPYKSFLAGDDIEPTPFNGDFTYIEDALNELYGDINDALPLSGGTMTGSIAMGNHKITGLSPGTVSTDAVNKSQLDAKLDLTGGNLAGTLDLGNHKITGVTAGTDPNDVVTVSQLASGSLPLSGGTMTGTIDMGSNKITQLANSTVDTDVINRGQAKSIGFPGTSFTDVTVLASGSTYTAPTNGYFQFTGSVASATASMYKLQDTSSSLLGIREQPTLVGALISNIFPMRANGVMQLTYANMGSLSLHFIPSVGG